LFVTNVDNHGLSVSTLSSVAAGYYRDGVTCLLAAWPGAAERLDAAIADDPTFSLAYGARARLHGLRAEFVEARHKISEAERLVDRRGDERERRHIEVLSRALNGQPKKALDQALAHLDQWPRDTLILSLPLGAFGLFAFSGAPDHDQARVALCERHARHFDANDWWFLTYHGWSLTENGDLKRGRAMLERACALRSENANGIHAMAHVLFESGAGDEADQLIGGWLPAYDRSGILYGHIAWHAALVALERDDAERALAIYADQVQPAVSKGVPLNIVSDGASLLWRVAIYGHGVPAAAWKELSNFAGAAFPKASHAFVDAHMLMIDAAAGDARLLEQRVTDLEAMVRAGSLGAGVVAPTIGRAVLAFANGNFAECVRLLEPVAREVVRIGGSGAQREVIEDTLLQALMRNGATAEARALLKKRLHRRPSSRDQRWLGQVTT
jgi:hypothetical protein